MHENLTSELEIQWSRKEKHKVDRSSMFVVMNILNGWYFGLALFTTRFLKEFGSVL